MKTRSHITLDNRVVAPLLLAVWSVTTLFVTAPAQVRSTPETTLRGNRVLVIAHRGGAREATENTIPAFERAMRLGANGIETDLRLTRDGVVVLYHDDRYGRMEGLSSAQRTRLISEMTYAELSAQPLVPVGTGPGDARVATLDELLRGVRTGLLNIELKRGDRFDELVRKTTEALRNFGQLDRIVLEPPDLKTAVMFREALGPRLQLQINPGFDSTVPFEVSLERVLKFKPHSISVSYKKLSWEVVDLAHKAGVEVWVWTVDSPEIAQAMRLLGVDAIKTDRPATLLDLFKR